jgi:hypothetical protein
MKSGAVIYLVNHTEQSITDMKKSLRLLQTNYLKKFPCDVICFHEKELSLEVRNEISQDVRWVELDFSYPPWIDQSKICRERAPGYLHMCRFFGNSVFHHSVLQEYEYTLRLDTDSEILSPIQVNLFETAHNRKIIYGYVDDTIRDQPQFIYGLRDCCQQIVNVEHLEIGRVYYTNIELCRRDWFISNPWNALSTHIDFNGGIYYHRWGDAPIRYIGVQLYTKPADRWILPVHYRHQVFTYDRRKG